MPLEFVRHSNAEAETAAIGRLLGGMLRPGDMLLLDGPLGAGKTLLVRAMVDGMGLELGAASSPTYVLVHLYRRSGAGDADTPALVHVDAYRLRGEDDFESLGLRDLLRTHGGVGPPLVVEWAERLPAGALPGVDRAGVRIEPTDQTSRDLWFTLPDAWKERPGLDQLRQRRSTTCPITRKSVPADSPTWPFADERARSADLYRWFKEAYAIGGPIEPLDED